MSFSNSSDSCELIPVITDLSFRRKPGTMDHLGFAVIASVPICCCEDPSESADESAIFGATHLHSEGLEHFGATTKSNGLTLLLQRKCAN